MTDATVDEGCERVDVGDAVRLEQARQDRRRGRGVGQCVVRAVEGDAVAVAQVAQAVRQRSIGSSRRDSRNVHSG